MEAPKMEENSQNLAAKETEKSLKHQSSPFTVSDPLRKFGSMNMEEFLTNIWNFEDVFDASQQPTVQAELRRKTVDEVWADIHQERQRCDDHERAEGNKPSMGEMTLEDFLVKAGVMREGKRGEFDGGLMELGGRGSPASPMSSDGMGMDGRGGCGGRKRMAAEGVGEKGVERRQRRMIKNRESAARSRARKQAYTVELEMELKQLVEQNARLRDEESKVRQMRKQIILEAMEKQTHHNMVINSRSIRRCNSNLS